MAAHAAAPGADPAGRVIYDVYFNVDHGGDARWRIDNTTANPRSAAAYAALTWGSSSSGSRGDTTATPDNPPPQPCPTVVPTPSASPPAPTPTSPAASPSPWGT